MNLVSTGWSARLLVPLAIALFMALFRRFAPPPPLNNSIESYFKEGQVRRPLPKGAIGGLMWLFAFLIASSFFLLKWANHQWAEMDGPAALRLYKTPIVWCFLPGFAALAVPWPFTVWLLQVLGRTDEAYVIRTESAQKIG